MSGQFAPGQSGNPKGRPVGSKSLTTVIRRRFLENPEEAQVFAEAMIRLAMKGNAKAIELVRYALDGPQMKHWRLEQLTATQLLELMDYCEDVSEEDATDG